MRAARKLGLALSMILGGAGLGGNIAHAAQIFVQQAGTSPAGGDPNGIGDTSAFVIGLAGAGHTSSNPVLVGVAIPDTVLGSASISYSGCSTPAACDLAAAGTYGLTGNMATLTAGTVFDAVGLTQAGGSVSFVNMSSVDALHGFGTPTSYALTVFALPASLAGSSSVTIDTGAPDGSFIFAFSCETGTGSSSGCAKNGDVDQTVFTNVGFINSSGGGGNVPEPATLLILGSGLLGIGLLRQYRR